MSDASAAGPKRSSKIIMTSSAMQNRAKTGIFAGICPEKLEGVKKSVDKTMNLHNNNRMNSEEKKESLVDGHELTKNNNLSSPEMIRHEIECLFEEKYRRIFSICSGKFPYSPFLADQAVAEAFTNVLDTMKNKGWVNKFGEPIEPNEREAYLVRAAQNACIKIMKEEGKYISLIEGMFESHGKSPIEDMIKEEQLKIVYEVLDVVNWKDRQIFLKKRLEGKTLKEIGIQFEMTEEGVRQVVLRVKNRILRKYNRGTI